MPITDTQELFLHELSEIYDAEHRFAEGQQEMAQNATDGQLESTPSASTSSTLVCTPGTWKRSSRSSARNLGARRTRWPKG